MLSRGDIVLEIVRSDDLSALLKAHEICHNLGAAHDCGEAVKFVACELFSLPTEAYESDDPNWGGGVCYTSDLASHVEKVYSQHV